MTTASETVENILAREVCLSDAECTIVREEIRTMLEGLAGRVVLLGDNPATFGKGHAYYEQALNDVVKLIREA